MIRNLYDAEKSLGALHEFGALHYSNLEQETPCELKAYKLPAAYFDSLIFAVNNAAKDLQVESSRGSEVRHLKILHVLYQIFACF